MLVTLPSGAIAQIVYVADNQSPRYSRIKDGHIRCHVEVVQARKHHKKWDRTFADVPAKDVHRWQKQQEKEESR